MCHISNTNHVYIIMITIPSVFYNLRNCLSNPTHSFPIKIIVDFPLSS